ncbi:hypothetical protein DLAC_08807 [Tieghemostelium lacteum]|uniref:S-adenosylmethionine-dependent methyltransferase domain-containing protein n=1 Tax=Tieghemostelium lacteum TaxID=361077 RepID=A0A151Z8E2_TIELA|nr:hypothetical protein DLAC_08807 [Tieghemostelium lacteum]|eukprot:KYQ90207.1 hypothetical protein DLAC_08807 [Tieghemostelium lacteum]
MSKNAPKVYKLLKNVEDLFKTKKNFFLDKSYIKDFSRKEGIVNFQSTDDSIKGFCLIDPSLTPAIRVFTFDEPSFSHEYLKKSIETAIGKRKDFAQNSLLDIGMRSAYRMVNEDGDNLPGLLIDKYGEYFLVTTLTPHWSVHMNYLSEFLINEIGGKGVYWRQKFTGIPKQTKLYRGSALPVDYRGISDYFVEEDGMKVIIDFQEQYASGLYLEHRDTRKFIASLFENRDSGSLLVPFSHTATFSLYLAYKGMKVQTYNIETSNLCMDMAEKNFKLNGIPTNYHKFIRRDAISHLDYMKSRSTKFDVIFLDPPPYSKSYNSPLFTTKNDYRSLLDSTRPLLNDGGYILPFVNINSDVKLERWLRQIGLKNYLKNTSSSNEKLLEEQVVQEKQKQQYAQQKLQFKKLGQRQNQEFQMGDELKEFKKLNIQDAKFSKSTISVFEQFHGFKWKQDIKFPGPVDFVKRPNDPTENYSRNNCGVVLHHKVDYYKTKYISPKVRDE